jgi:hypothetical protein
MSVSRSNSRTNKSNIDSEFKAGLKTPLPLLTKEFLRAAYSGNNPEKELRLAKRMGEFGGAQAKLQSARAIAGVAFRHVEFFGSQSSLLFSEAFENASRASWLNTNGIVRYQAEKFKLSLPLLSLISENTLPDKSLIKANLDSRIEMLPSLLDYWSKIQASKDTRKITDTVGYMSEEAVGLLLSRWVVSNSVDSYVPVDSLLSQDSARLTHSEIRTGWDISIYTNYPYIPALSHRLQVKTNPQSEKLYSDSEDFNIVTVSDLRLPRERSVYAHPESILKEIHANATSNGSDARQAGAYLDCRTEVLLDIFS